MTLSPRTLLTTYHHAYLKRAGGEFEIFSIAEKLKQQGLIADIYGPFSRALEHYDVILHFSVHGGGLDLLRHVREHGKPVVLWPNLWLNGPVPAIESLVQEHTGMASIVVFKSQAERDMFSRYFSLPEQKLRQVITPADAIYRTPAPANLFRSLYELERYVIGVGIIEPNKNQLAVIRALKGKGIKLVLIGSYRDADYYHACRQEGGQDVLFIDALPARSEILRSALTESDAFIECSYEPPGLSAIEAGLAGARLVLSDSPWTREHFGDWIDYCQPSDPVSIQAAIENAIRRLVQPLELADRLLRHCSDDASRNLTRILREAVA